MNLTHIQSSAHRRTWTTLLSLTFLGGCRSERAPARELELGGSEQTEGAGQGARATFLDAFLARATPAPEHPRATQVCTPISPGMHGVRVVLVASSQSHDEIDRQAELEGLQRAMDELLEAGPSSSIGLVEVSTHSRALQELTSDRGSLRLAADRVRPDAGYRALWDGVRLASELLWRDSPPCASQAVVVFTDAKENNSAGEHGELMSEHLDTRLSDLTHLAADGRPTSIFALGIGGGVDQEALRHLAVSTGGEYFHSAGWSDFPATLLSALARVRADRLPRSGTEPASDPRFASRPRIPRG